MYLFANDYFFKDGDQINALFSSTVRITSLTLQRNRGVYTDKGVTLKQKR